MSLLPSIVKISEVRRWCRRGFRWFARDEIVREPLEADGAAENEV
jgi:hypothetical protein